MFAQRLTPGDEIRVIAPSTSMAVVKGKQIELALKRLNDLGFVVTFGKSTEVHDEFFSSSVEERLIDLHEAFGDPQVKGIFSAFGGYNANHLLRSIDYRLISQNPKIFCGHGDITALQLAMYQKTGLVSYYGPHFSTFGMKGGLDYTLRYFLEAVTNDAPFEIEPSETWSDDPWYLEIDQRTYMKNDGNLVLQEGEASGILIGGNLATMSLLHGTELMPSLKNAVLFIEDDEETHARIFDRQLQSLLYQPGAHEIRAILIGRFQQNSQMTNDALKKIIASKQGLQGIPIIANVNIGHVHPFATIPIGSVVNVSAVDGEVEITIEQTE